MFRRGKRDRLKDSAISASALAVQLAQDRRFRRRLISALQHSSEARRRTRRELGLAGVARRFAADEALHAELKGARDDLQKAYARLEAKRRGSRLRKLFVLSLAAAFAAVPRLREAVKSAVTKAPQGVDAVRGAAGDVATHIPGREPARPNTLEDLSKEELYARAQEADIPGRSDMSKDQLIAALRARG
jgi:hypothetical protein